MNFRTLNRILSTLSDGFENINFGGCGVVALALAPHIKEIYNNYTIRGIDSNQKDLENNAPEYPDSLYDWNAEGIYFGHIVLEFKHKGVNWVVDANGVHTMEGLLESYSNYGSQVHKGQLLYKDLERMVNSPEGWNSMFDRGQIPSLRCRIDELFELYGDKS